MRFRKAARARVSINRRALKLLVQLPPITMLLQMLDSPASDIPSFLLG
jgi:hypothetical protein